MWAYPRPPRVEPSNEQVDVWLGDRMVARSTSTVRVLETSHPPTYYLPVGDFAPESLRPALGFTYCEWKGTAAYFDVVAGEVVAARAAWTYPRPAAGYEVLVDHVALYPGAMTRCTVDGEVVRPQPGSFYGGWVTSRVVGPFKGVPGSTRW